MYQFLTEQSCAQDEAALSRAMKHLEEKYQITFPPVLRDYYTHFNGVRIKRCGLTVDHYSCEVSRIIPIIAERMSFEHIVDRNREGGYLSDRLFPLAMDRGGDLYYWDADGGGVVLVRSDDIEHPFPVADSVQQFFTQLDLSSRG